MFLEVPDGLSVEQAIAQLKVLMAALEEQTILLTQGGAIVAKVTTKAGIEPSVTLFK